MKNLHLLPKKTQNWSNIHITSDEKIKDKCYVLSSSSIGALYLDGIINTARMLAEGQWKKIILTTDQDLIKDGIQAIDDEFLEWFVKNPSCESVKIEIEYKDGYGNWSIYNKEFWDKQGNRPKFGTRYKIIIPKEEPKQETLEEVAENYGWRIKTNTFSDSVKANELANSAKQDFINGAKWQQERNYSEEDLRNAYRWGTTVNHGTKEHFNEWFEQFKKK